MTAGTDQQAEAARLTDRFAHSTDAEMINGAARLICDGLLAYENGPVYAIVGNAADPELQVRIMRAKGDQRGIEPVGCTMPFDDPLLEGIYETSHITNPRLRDFLENPDQLTAFFGGVAFLRGLGDLDVKDGRQIPDAIFPQPVEGKSTFQNWSPEGNERTNLILRTAISRGAITAMSSLNWSSRPEIIDEATARQFASDMGLPLISRPDEDRPERPRGSYLTYLVQEDRLSVIRLGNVTLELARHLVPDGVEVTLDEARKQPDPKYPDNVLRLEDIGAPFRPKPGDARKFMLQAMGVDQAA